MRTPAAALGIVGLAHDPDPQGAVFYLFGLEALGPDKAVAIGRLAILQANRVDHPVAVEGMIAADAVVHRVFGVADVEAVNIVRNGPDYF
jgi:hypothetical protein